jgi:hypothetical protein
MEVAKMLFFIICKENRTTLKHIQRFLLSNLVSN